MEQLAKEIEKWMVSYKQTSVKQATYNRLEVSLEMLKRHPISEVYVDELTTDDIQNYINDLVIDGYALSTIRKQVHLIGAYISHENYTGRILRPIHKGVKIPSEMAVRKHCREIVAYTKEEQAALKKIFYRGDSPTYYAALIMMETGMRIGETLALGWNDIDWNRRCIRIHKTVVHIESPSKSYVQYSAKSYSSNRVIPISTAAYELLREMYDSDNTDSPFVFHDKRGKRLNYGPMVWWVRKACEEAGVEYYGQHVFRHTFATNCYDRGCDVKLLSKLLGHADVRITYDVYIHLFGDALEEMRTIVG